MDRADGEIDQLITNLVTTKTRLVERAKLRAGLSTSVEHHEIWLAEASERLHCVLEEVRSVKSGERRRVSMPASSRLSATDSRLAAELDYLGSQQLLGSLDTFINELSVWLL